MAENNDLIRVISRGACSLSTNMDPYQHDVGIFNRSLELVIAEEPTRVAFRSSSDPCPPGSPPWTHLLSLAQVCSPTAQAIAAHSSGPRTEVENSHIKIPMWKQLYQKTIEMTEVQVNLPTRYLFNANAPATFHLATKPCC